MLDRRMISENVQTLWLNHDCLSSDKQQSLTFQDPIMIQSCQEKSLGRQKLGKSRKTASEMSLTKRNEAKIKPKLIQKEVRENAI